MTTRIRPLFSFEKLVIVNPGTTAVDEEFVRQHSDVPDESADAAHVMTTWHADESPDDVAFFFVLNTNFNEHDFKRFLVLHVGDGHAKAKSMRRYGGTSTRGRPDKPLQPDGLRPRLSGKAFGRQERASRVASTRVTFVGRIPNLGLLHVFAGR